jgi:parallel beta-helix repeat protein
MKRKWLALGIILLFIGSAIIPSNGQQIEKSSSTRTRGNTLYVGGSGPGNYSKIQDAINNASDGDTIFVYHNSTSYGDAHIIKSLIVRGEDKETTLLHFVYLESENITISDFTIYAIYGSHSPPDNISIINNIFPKNGIDYSDGKNIRIINNTFTYSGIYIFFSENNTVTGNTIIANTTDNQFVCMKLMNARHSIVSNNTLISVCGVNNGLYLESASNIIENNSFINTGISMTVSSCDNIFKGNTINGRVFLFLNGEANKTIDTGDNVGQVVLSKCNQITLCNLNISNVPQGITLVESTKCNIMNNSVSLCGQGIVLSSSSYMNTVNKNTITHCSDGLEIISNSNNLITNNSIMNCYIGIRISSSSKNVIKRNSIQKNSYYGIYVEAGSPVLGSNIVQENNFIKNKNNVFFNDILRTHWLHNYWNRPRISPKIIFGIIYINNYGYLPWIIPWFNFDWHPALLPFDIPGMR